MCVDHTLSPANPMTRNPRTGKTEAPAEAQALSSASQVQGSTEAIVGPQQRPKDYYCRQRGCTKEEGFGNPKNRWKHELICKGEGVLDLLCDKCNRDFDSHRGIDDHLRNDHKAPKSKPAPKKERPFKCSFCDSGYSDKADLVLHIETWHSKAVESQGGQASSSGIPIEGRPETPWNRPSTPFARRFTQEEGDLSREVIPRNEGTSLGSMLNPSAGPSYVEQAALRGRRSTTPFGERSFPTTTRGPSPPRRGTVRRRGHSPDIQIQDDSRRLPPPGGQGFIARGGQSFGDPRADPLPPPAPTRKRPAAEIMGITNITGTTTTSAHGGREVSHAQLGVANLGGTIGSTGFISVAHSMGTTPATYRRGQPSQSQQWSYDTRFPPGQSVFTQPSFGGTTRKRASDSPDPREDPKRRLYTGR